ncbi:MAG: glycosyltransferase family 4 protein [Acetobacteraceae bacterium]|nr:glycosyltransferase family 4 protein [Acetobacteraceae bacterium]
MNRSRNARRQVFLTCPYGQVGGGMGSIMQYLADMGTDPSGRFEFARLESRGGGSIVLSPVHLAFAVLRIFVGAARGRLAVVHLNLAERGSVYRKGVLLYAARLAGVKVLLHLHAAQIIAFHQSLPRPGRALLRGMFRSADHVVVLGELWRRWVIDTFDVAPQAISVVNNGVPATPLPRVPRTDGEPFRLLFLGNLLERKGIADLLHALAMPTARDADLHLTVAGGGAVDTYKALADELGIGARVEFTGWLDQAAARRCVTKADALVLPAYDEGLPLVILEAMATGVPVVCTPVGAIPEVFTNRDSALFVTPGDRPALAEALIELSRDPALQAQLSSAGLGLYHRQFTMTAFAERIAALYATLVRPRADQVAQHPVMAEAGDDR